jgi:hypothetical protein
VENPEAVLSRVADMTEEIKSKVARRAIVFPTGFELRQGLIEDTNTPFLKELLESKGFTVTVGDIMEDSLEDVYFKLDDALSRGFGLILTTGGVGAEDKDCTVEGIEGWTPPRPPPILEVSKGTGRHVKDGVRIGVGKEAFPSSSLCPALTTSGSGRAGAGSRAEEGWSKNCWPTAWHLCCRKMAPKSEGHEGHPHHHG